MMPWQPPRLARASLHSNVRGICVRVNGWVCVRMRYMCMCLRIEACAKDRDSTIGDCVILLQFHHESDTHIHTEAHSVIVIHSYTLTCARTFTDTFARDQRVSSLQEKWKKLFLCSSIEGPPIYFIGSEQKRSRIKKKKSYTTWK